MENINNTKNTISRWHNFRIKIIIEGILVGFVAGLLAILYRMALEKAFEFCKIMYTEKLTNGLAIGAWFVFLILGGYIVGRIIKAEPMASGSGIPQVEGVLIRKMHTNWFRVIVAKFVGGALCILGGLSMGREGPSIQMGAAGGQGLSKILKRVKLEEKFLMTSGASAGLAAAFNAPLAGVIFALEEVHKNFSPIVMTSALAASITADFMSKNFFGMKPMLNFRHIQAMPLNYYLYVIVLGVIIGVCGVLFNKTLIKTQKLYAKSKWLKAEFKPIIPFLIAGVVGLTVPFALGGGHDVIIALDRTNFTLKMVLIILVVKFLFTMISYGSSAPGGIFLPLLAIGALIGVAYGYILRDLFGFNQIYIENLMILGMAGYFTAIVKAPITGSVLITEMTGSFTHLLPIGLVCLTAYVVSDLLNSKPIYEELLENMLEKAETPTNLESKTKVILEMAVCIGSCIEHKMLKDIEWPVDCLVVGIMRGKKEIIPKGNTIVYGGDYLIILADEHVAAEVRDSLTDLIECCDTEKHIKQ